jgi:hypothetical protein
MITRGAMKLFRTFHDNWIAARYGRRVRSSVVWSPVYNSEKLRTPRFDRITLAVHAGRTFSLLRWRHNYGYYERHYNNHAKHENSSNLKSYPC